MAVLSDKSAQASEALRACILGVDKRAPLSKTSVAAGLEVDAQRMARVGLEPTASGSLPSKCLQDRDG